MSAEDRLREILHNEAESVVPAGDGLARIRERVVRRRRLRVALVPASALVVAAAVTAFVVLGPAGTQELQQGPASPGPSPSPSAIQGDLNGPAIWPFTSSADAARWPRSPGDRPWASDPTQVVEHFLSDFLRLSGVSVISTGGQATLQRGGRDIGTVYLASVNGGRGWTITSVDGGDLTVTAPAAGATISSPTTVSGRITGLHESVRLQLLTSAGQEIAATSAPAGQEAPWQGALAWTDTTWSAGGLIGTTRSDRDGSLTRLVAVPVSRDKQTPVRPDSFVGLVDGKVLLFAGSDGKKLSQLTYPPAGFTDTAATWANGSLAWVRSRDTGCSNTLFRKTGDQITTVEQPGSYVISTLQLSPSGGRLSWVQAPCGGGQGALVVSGGAAPDHVVPLPPETDSRVLDVDADGTVLLLTRPGEGSGQPALRRVPAGSTDLNQSQVLATDGTQQGNPPTACGWDAAAFEGSNVVAGETCGSMSRLVHINAAGERVSVDPVLPGTSRFATISVRGTAILVQTFDSDVDSDGVVGTYVNGRISGFVSPSGCDAETGAGCLRQPDW